MQKILASIFCCTVFAVMQFPYVTFTLLHLTGFWKVWSSRGCSACMAWDPPVALGITVGSAVLWFWLSSGLTYDSIWDQWPVGKLVRNPLRRWFNWVLVEWKETVLLNWVQLFRVSPCLQASSCSLLLTLLSLVRETDLSVMKEWGFGSNTGKRTAR